jgi:CheY-like chemotaxis protein
MMPTKEKMKLGEILTQQKILTPLIVERVIRIANSTHRRFGQTLEDLGLLTGEEIARALAIQFGYKIVTDICRFVIPPDVLRLVPMETAFENRVFPLGVREGNLALAMADPTNTDIVTTLAADLNLRVVPFIAITQDIMKAIAKNYLGEALESRTNSVLVVETDYRTRETVVSSLTKEGYPVVEAVDATDGFQQALLHLPSLVITAKEMPDSDGFALFTSLQGVAETRRIPIILLSQRASDEEEATAFKRGFFDYIPVPVREITLVSRVARALAAGKSYVPYCPEGQGTPEWQQT